LYCTFFGSNQLNKMCVIYLNVHPKVTQLLCRMAANIFKRYKLLLGTPIKCHVQLIQTFGRANTAIKTRFLTNLAGIL